MSPSVVFRPGNSSEGSEGTVLTWDEGLASDEEVTAEVTDAISAHDAAALAHPPIRDQFTVEAWHNVGEAGEPGFQNSWVNRTPGNNPAGFYLKDERVYLRGTVRAGTVGSEPTGTIFTLPAGFRPAFREFIATFADSATGSRTIARCDILTDGQVVAVSGANEPFALDNLSFRIA